jgi:hypothetical protein
LRPGRIIGIVAAIGFAGFVFYSLLHTEPVRVVMPRLQRNGSSESVAGAVENTGSSEQAIDLEIRYYDPHGHQVATDTVKIDHLGSGETRSFAGPPRALPDGASYSVYLNHGRNAYGN